MWDVSALARCVVVVVIVACGRAWGAPAPAEPELASSDASSAPADELFYFGPRPGSESQFGPLNVVWNVGMMTATPGTNPSLARPWGEHLQRLGGMYLQPGRSIRQGYGSFGVFAFLEFVPILGVVSTPNYALHFLGEGMLSRKLEEYYRYQGLQPAWAKVAGISTIVVAQQLNEVTEMTFVADGDPVADLFFNAAGIAAFSFDGFARLFAGPRVALLWWPGQAFIDVRDAAVYNQAEVYNLRFAGKNERRLRPGILMGTANGVGLAYGLNSEDFVSLHVVVRPDLPGDLDDERPIEPISYREVEEEDDGGGDGRSSVALRWSWDQSGSLMASLDLAVLPRFQVTANLYPGLLAVGPVGVGAFVHAGVASPTALGVTVSALSVMPGLRL